MAGDLEADRRAGFVGKPLKEEIIQFIFMNTWRFPNFFHLLEIYISKIFKCDLKGYILVFDRVLLYDWTIIIYRIY
jgi:hypothetical protein